MLYSLLLREAGIFVLDDDARAIGDVERLLRADDHALADIVLQLREAEVPEEGAGEGIRVGEALVQRAFEEGFGIEESGLGKDVVGRVDVQVEGFVGCVDEDVVSVEIVPGAVVDTLLDGRHGADALDFFVRVCAAEHLAVDDDGGEIGEALLEHPIYLKDALAIALGQFLPLVEVFTIRYNSRALGKLDLLPVAEEAAVGTVDLFLNHETGSGGGVVAHFFHEGAVEGVLDGTVFFECQHSVTFSAKVRRFRVLYKSLQGLQEFGNEEDNRSRKRNGKKQIFANLAKICRRM